MLAKYGWTLDYLLWGISYVNAKMLLADSIQAYYNGENKKTTEINADDPENEEYIDSLLNN